MGPPPRYFGSPFTDQRSRLLPLQGGQLSGGTSAAPEGAGGTGRLPDHGANSFSRGGDMARQLYRLLGPALVAGLVAVLGALTGCDSLTVGEPAYPPPAGTG